MGTTGLKRDQAHGQFLHAGDIDAQEIAHKDAGDRQGQDEEQGKVVGSKGNVAYLREHHAPHEQIGNRRQQHQVAEIDERQSHLHDAVGLFEDQHKEGDGIGEEAQMPQKDHQKGVVESQAGQPQPFLPLIGDLRPLVQFHLGIAEKRPEEENLQQHAADGAGCGGWVVQFVLLHPRQGLLLAAGGGDPKRNRRARPDHDAVDEAQEERAHGRIGNIDRK